MMSEFINILWRIAKIDKRFFGNNRNFGDASIYFAILIILISSLISLIPNKAFIEYMSFNFGLGNVKGPSLRFVLFFSYLFWIIKTTYLYFIGVIIFPNRNTKCNFRKVLVLVGYAQVPLFFNLLVIDSSLLILLFFTYIWYNVSLIVGLNIILSYNNFFKSSIIVLAPLIIFFIYLLSLLTPLQLNTIS